MVGRALRPALLAWVPATAVLGIFLVTGLRHLDSVPQVYEDEPWQASTAYKLVTSGVFGSDLFAGFYHMDQRYYGFMPLHPLLMAAVFKLLGVGLAQARLETVLLTAATLVLTFALGYRLFNVWVGAIAVALLVLVRWTGLTYVQLTASRWSISRASRDTTRWCQCWAWAPSTCTYLPVRCRPGPGSPGSPVGPAVSDGCTR